jgi:tetratricopeptide (TPR) repeat protein
LAVISLACTLPASDDSLVDAARRAFAAGDVATTERLCQQALSVSPKDGSAWLLLTETALRRNRPDAAIVCAERAAALRPDDPIAPILRAKCLFVSGEFGLALEAAEAASARVGTQPEALDALGALFGMLGRHRQAEDLFRRAVAACPDVPQYRFNLAATERTIGAFAAAEAECDAAISLDRYYCLAHYLRSDLRSQTPERNHTAEMEALIGEGQIGRGGETLLRFALGKEFEDLGEYARAFDHISKGCALQRAATPYDPRRDIDEIDAIIRTQNRAWLDACPPGYRDADPIFVVGLPRTGTTLVERIIASQGGVISAGETGAFAVELRREMQKPGRPDFAELGRHYINAAAVFAGRGGRFVDKTLINYLYCGLIHAALPRAKIVLVHRHPLDTCWAIYKTLFQGHFPFSYDLAELAEYYLAYRRLARHWEAVLPPHALSTVHYEDIVRDQAETSRRLMAFAGLPWHDGVLQFHESDAPSATASAVQVRRPIYESSIGKWRYQAERLMPLRSGLAQGLPDAELA